MQDMYMYTAFRIKIIRYFHLLTTLWAAPAIYICNQTLPWTFVESVFTYHHVVTTMVMWPMFVFNDLYDSSPNIITICTEGIVPR